MNKKIKGQHLYKAAKKIIPGGSMLYSKRGELYLPDFWPSYFSKAKGCFVWTLDNKKLIDVFCGVGTNVMGYANSKIDKSVINSIKKSNMSSLNAPEEVLLAQKILNLHPWAHQAKFTRSGGEANAVAIRIARASTKRQNVAFCGYHGWHDWYLSSNINNPDNLNKHLMSGLKFKGVSEKLKDTAFPFTYNDIDSLIKLIKKHDIGIIKMEVMRNEIPKNDFLKKIKKICNKKKIILIFDECTSGFRESFGGIHLRYKINPDIAIFGKALGNGYAINAIIGKKNYMKNSEVTFISSTFWTERSGSVAAIATMNLMSKTKSYLFIKKQGKKIKSIWKKLSDKFDIPIDIFGLDSIPSFIFKKKNLLYKTYLAQEMLKQGFIATTVVYVSICHTDKILKKYENNLTKIFYKLKNKKITLEGKISYSPMRRLN